jgi:phosphotransferase system HPr (HPr) family protein
MEKDIKILLVNGLHARPAAYIGSNLCQMNLDSATVKKEDGTIADMKSVLSLLTVCITPDSVVRVKISGKDEIKAMALVEKVLSSKNAEEIWT